MRAQQNPVPANLVTSKISSLHPKINPADLQANGMLIDEKSINQIKLEFRDSPDGRISLNELREKISNNINFEVIKIGADYYALYDDKTKPLFVESRKLGEGAFGAVYLANHLTSQNPAENWAVVKVLSPPADELPFIEQEAAILKKAGQFKGKIIHDRIHSRDVEFIMHLAPGVNFTKMKEPTTICLIDDFINLLTNLQTLHSKGIIHCDIKGDNIQVDAMSKNVNFIDMGLAELCDPNGPLSAKSPYQKGTEKYMAPEIIHARREVIYSDKSDIYALGITLADKLDLLSQNNTVASEGSRRFTQNSIIADPQLRLLILQQLKKMTEVKPDQRPSLQQCLDFFKDIHDVHLNVLAQIKRVGYIDVNEYLQADQDTKKQMEKAFASTDELWFVDKNDNNKDNYLSLKRELQNKGITVGTDVIQYTEREEIPQKIALHVENQEKTRGCLLNTACFSKTVINNDNLYRQHAIKPIHIRPFADTSNYRQEMDDYLSLTHATEKHINFVTQSLQKELKRLKDKYPSSENKNDTAGKRMKLIQETCEKFEKNRGSITYSQMYDDLNSVQNKMHSTSYNLFSWIAEKFGYNFVTGKKEISDLITQVQKDTPQLRRR